MPIDDANTVTAYFDTPERAERLQLVLHLLRNADEVPYLRAPENAGKTRFAQRLLEDQSEEFSVIWLNAFAGESIEPALYGQLGLVEGEAVWPNDVLASSDEKPLLLIVDDADALDLASMGKMFELHDLGARLLFIGNGGLAQLPGKWNLQFVDLPAFSETQTFEFLAQSGYVSSGQINAPMAAGLYRASNGLPGLLIKSLTTLSLQTESQPKQKSSLGISPLVITVALVCLSLILLGWYFQDEINAVFEKPAIEAEPYIYTFDDVPEEVDEKTVSLPVKNKPDDGQQIKAIEREPINVAVKLKKEPEVSDKSLASSKKVQPEKEIRKAEVVEVLEQASTPEPPDPVFDAVVDAVIAAAAQEPEVDETEVVVGNRAEIEPVVAKKEIVVQEKPLAKAVIKKVAEKDTPLSVQETPQRPADTDTAWLLAQNPNSYTLQLVGAREKPSIRRFINKHKVAKPYAVFKRDLNGKPWYSLVAGVYSSRDAAVAARSKLKPSVKGGGVWPRTFASIQESLGSQR